MNITIDIDIERVRSLLCCALEGGSNYWYANLDAPEESRALDNGDWTWPYLAATTEGHHVTLQISSDRDDPDNGKVHRLDLEACKRGLEVMREKSPHQFGHFMAESEDACTGDVFLQCALFGEVVYG